MVATCRLPTVRDLGTIEGLTDALGYIEDLDEVIGELSYLLLGVVRFIEAPRDQGRDVLLIDIQAALRTADQFREGSRSVLRRLRRVG
jgi:hypothetical protein